jgi:hypothetical protein
MPCGAELQIGWIPVRKQVDKDDDVHSSDHIDVHIRMLPILEGEAQDAIVREELERHGWTREPDGTMSKVFGDAIAILPAGSSTIRLEVSESRNVKATGVEEGRAPEEDQAAQAAIAARAEAKAAAELELVKEEAKRDMIRRNIDRIERVQEELQREVEDVVRVATKRSLERRAAELGSVESVHENRSPEHGYELTITVRT